MSVMLMLAACGGNQAPTTKVYTSSQTITLPSTVSNLTTLTAQGGTGTPEDRDYVRRYREKRTVYNQRNDMGGQVVELDGGTTTKYGSTPEDYCTEPAPYYSNGVLCYTWTCYDFTNTSYWDTDPATTGGTTTMTGPNGFSKSWAGGYGGPDTPSSESNVAVVASGQYVLTIPSGGSITISYYE